jgi:hypothetical protein
LFDSEYQKTDAVTSSVQVKVSQLNFEDSSQNSTKHPSARTYHATTLVGQFMVVVGGESNSSDLNDLWALNLEEQRWYKPTIQGLESF